ncbi:MAG: thermonuclease family protein [Pseudomonadota bacterium]
MLLTALAITICPAPPTPRHHCVHDGDTVWWQGEKLRLASIDTPELDSERAEIRAAAVRARDRLVELLALYEVRIERLGRDRYGRTLACIYSATGPIGAQLIREGLATRWRGAKSVCERSVQDRG